MGEPDEVIVVGNVPVQAERDGLLSIVVPMYNEAHSIDAFFECLLDVLTRCGQPFEVICVDDGSTDATADKVRAWLNDDPRIVRVELTRNFGKERALAAGFDHTSGDAVIPIDADLQDPPEVILDLVAQWRLGYDMVVASRRGRPGDSALKRHSAAWFYRIMNHLSEVPLPENAGDFRLLDRKVVDALRNLGERTRFHKGLYAWLGYRTSIIQYDRPDREAGESKWSYWRLWNHALDGIFSFSTAPLRLWSYVGGLLALAGFVYAGFIVARTLVQGVDVPGYASLLVLMLLVNGLIMIGIGVVGEYVGRIFTEVKKRPTYLVEAIEQGADAPPEASRTPVERRAP